jgi:hypothetical protein
LLMIVYECEYLPDSVVIQGLTAHSYHVGIPLK